MVIFVLQSSLEISIIQAYSNSETAKELWDTLHKVYGNTSNLTRIFEVKKAINNLQQEDLMVLFILQSSLDISIIEAYSNCETTKELWDTLHKIYGNTSNLTRIFEVKKTINNLQQEDLMVLFVLQSSLDISIIEAYSNCKTAKELQDTLHKVYGNTSNLTIIFEVKKTINNLQHDEMNCTKHLGRFSELWSELEMLRPSTTNHSILNERREQDKVFRLLLTLNLTFNDIIKHILNAKELPSMDDVCPQLQKELGSYGLSGGKGELSMTSKAEKVEIVAANKAAYKPGGDRRVTCEHCKKQGHSKSKFWIFHPHLRPTSANKFNPPRAHEAPHPNYNPMRMGEDGRAMVSTTHDVGSTSQATSQLPHDDAFICKSDIEVLIKALNANSGNISINALNSTHIAS